MISLNRKVGEILSRIDGVNVSYKASADWTKKQPLITYFEVSNIPGVIAEDREYASSIIMQVDLWVDSAPELERYALEIDRAMTAAGFIRKMAHDIPDITKKHRKMLQYTILI